MNKRDKAADQRLRRTYGITLKEYNQMFKTQGNGCGICGSKPRLNTRVTASFAGIKAIAKTKERALRKLAKIATKKKIGINRRKVKYFEHKFYPRLAVDHDHKWKYRKVITKERFFGVGYEPESDWKAYFKEFPHIKVRAGKRNEAIKKLRKLAIRKSVRGIICFGCNGGLRKFRDNAKFLASASKYLKRYEERCKEENVN